MSTDAPANEQQQRRVTTYQVEPLLLRVRAAIQAASEASRLPADGGAIALPPCAWIRDASYVVPLTVSIEPGTVLPEGVHEVTYCNHPKANVRIEGNFWIVVGDGEPPGDPTMLINEEPADALPPAFTNRRLPIRTRAELAANIDTIKHEYDRNVQRLLTLLHPLIYKAATRAKNYDPRLFSTSDVAAVGVQSAMSVIFKHASSERPNTNLTSHVALYVERDVKRATARHTSFSDQQQDVLSHIRNHPEITDPIELARLYVNDPTRLARRGTNRNKRGSKTDHDRVHEIAAIIRRMQPYAWIEDGSLEAIAERDTSDGIARMDALRDESTNPDQLADRIPSLRPIAEDISVGNPTGDADAALWLLQAFQRKPLDPTQAVRQYNDEALLRVLAFLAPLSDTPPIDSTDYDAYDSELRTLIERFQNLVFRQDKALLRDPEDIAEGWRQTQQARAHTH